MNPFEQSIWLYRPDRNGKAAIIVGASDKLIPTIETIISAVQAGELDSHLTQMGFTKAVRKPRK